MDRSNEVLLGKLAIDRGYLTQPQLDALLREQAARPGKLLSQLLVERHFLASVELESLLRTQAANLARPSDYSSRSRGETLLGQEAVRRGWLTPERLHEAVRAQGLAEGTGAGRRLGEVLVQLGYLHPGQVTELLEYQTKRIVSCPNCSTQYNASRIPEGGALQCPRCGARLQDGARGERLDAAGSFLGERVALPPAAPALPAAPPVTARAESRGPAAGVGEKTVPMPVPAARPAPARAPVPAPRYVPRAGRDRVGRPGPGWVVAAGVAGVLSVVAGFLVFVARAAARRDAEAAALQAHLESSRTQAAALEAEHAALVELSNQRPLDLFAFAQSCGEFAARAGDSPLGARAKELAAAVRREAEEGRAALETITTRIEELLRARAFGEARKRLRSFPATSDVEGQLAPRLRELDDRIQAGAEAALGPLADEALRLAAAGKSKDGLALLDGASAWGIASLAGRIRAAREEVLAADARRGKVAVEDPPRARPEEQEAAKLAAIAASRRKFAVERVDAARARIREAHAEKARAVAEQSKRIVEATARQPLELPISEGMVLKRTRVLEYREDGVTLESEEPRVRMPIAFDSLEPKEAYYLRRMAADSDSAEDHFRLGCFCTLRDLFDVAQREFDQAVKLDAGFLPRLPDLRKFRERKKIFKGSWRRIGKSFLHVEYGFAADEEVEDFRAPAGTHASVGNGALLVAGQRFFYVAPKEIAFVDEVRVGVRGLTGNAASPFIGLFFGKGGEPESGYMLSVDPAGTQYRVLRMTAGGAAEALAGPARLPAGALEMRFANLKFEVSAGRKSLWRGEANRFSEVVILVGGIAAERGSVRVDRLSLDGKVPEGWVRKTFSEAETLAMRELEEDLKARPGPAIPLAEPDTPLSIEAEGLRGLSKQGLAAYRAAKAAVRTGEIADPARLQQSLDALIKEAPGFPGGYFYRGLLTYVFGGETAAGLSDVRRALGLAPNFHEARIALARLLLHRNDLTGARAELERVLETVPDCAEGYAARGSLEFHEHRYDAAIDDLELVLELAPRDGETRRRLRNARHVRRGPGWSKTFTKETEHYVVRTDISSAKATELAANLETVAAFYAASFGVRLPTEPKGDVLVFDTREGYQTYAELSINDRVEFTGGYYHPEYRQLLLFEDKADVTGEQTAQVMFHEGFHQFFHPLAPEPPFWLNEGLAEYMSAVELKGGQVARKALVLEGRLRGLRGWLDAGGALVPFQQLMLETPAEFYGGPPELVSLKYAQAWAMLHYFMSAREPALKTAIDAYIALLREGASSRSAFQKAWGGVDLAATQQAFVAYVRGLR
ncbi:MAG: tetratricopeptide repeat protein [Planctomycetes bacterium]|nr:tetratricopeptide repeat protein [Planctomycetota bacterium]